jgi:hypothetical protein
MKMRIIWFIILGTLGIGCGDRSVPPWEQIREELLAMEQTDQAVREGLTGASLGDTMILREMLAVDSVHTRRLREIVEAYGWPGVSDVGEQGANAAWLLLQHSPDFEFQRTTLGLMEEASERGEASPRSLALLTDRVLIHQNRPQRYGTQFRFIDGGLEFYPIEDSATVDERRASVGLPPLEEYRRLSEDFYQLGVQDTLREPGGQS